MKLEIIEDEKNKLKIAVHGESHTLLNVLRENAWKAGADQASYLMEHPYLSDPQLIIHGENPRKILTASIQLLIEEAKDFEKEFSAVVKK